MNAQNTMRDLSELNSVRELKGLNPGEMAVAVEATQTYQDPKMRVPSTRVLLPDEVLGWIDLSDWELESIGFYTSGDYQGCFAIRIIREGDA